MTIWDDLATHDATKALSVNNVMRREGLTDQADIQTFLAEEWLEDSGPFADELPSDYVTDGVAFLVAENFATLDGDTVVPEDLDPDGIRPAQLRRDPEDDEVLELAP